MRAWSPNIAENLWTQRGKEHVLDPWCKFYIVEEKYIRGLKMHHERLKCEQFGEIVDKTERNLSYTKSHNTENANSSKLKCKIIIMIDSFIAQNQLESPLMR